MSSVSVRFMQNNHVPRHSNERFDVVGSVPPWSCRGPTSGPPRVGGTRCRKVLTHSIKQLPLLITRNVCRCCVRLETPSCSVSCHSNYQYKSIRRSTFRGHPMKTFQSPTNLGAVLAFCSASLTHCATKSGHTAEFGKFPFTLTALAHIVRNQLFCIFSPLLGASICTRIGPAHVLTSHPVSTVVHVVHLFRVCGSILVRHQVCPTIRSSPRSRKRRCQQ